MYPMIQDQASQLNSASPGFIAPAYTTCRKQLIKFYSCKKCVHMYHTETCNVNGIPTATADDALTPGNFSLITQT